MPARVGFEFGRYKVKESCTLLSVTLIVKGEVLRPFTVGVYLMSFYVPSAIGTYIYTYVCVNPLYSYRMQLQCVYVCTYIYIYIYINS